MKFVSLFTFALATLLAQTAVAAEPVGYWVRVGFNKDMVTIHTTRTIAKKGHPEFASICTIEGDCSELGVELGKISTVTGWAVWEEDLSVIKQDSSSWNQVFPAVYAALRKSLGPMARIEYPAAPEGCVLVQWGMDGLGKVWEIAPEPQPTLGQKAFPFVPSLAGYDTGIAITGMPPLKKKH